MGIVTSEKNCDVSMHMYDCCDKKKGVTQALGQVLIATLSFSQYLLCMYVCV